MNSYKPYPKIGNLPSSEEVGKPQPPWYLLSPKEQRLANCYFKANQIFSYSWLLLIPFMSFIFGIPWIISLPFAISSLGYIPIPATITTMDPHCSGRSFNRGIIYHYTYQGITYANSRVIVFPLDNNFLPDCGFRIWNDWYKKENPKTHAILVTAYIDKSNPAKSVLLPGFHTTPKTEYGIFSTLIMSLHLFCWIKYNRLNKKAWKIGRALNRLDPKNPRPKGIFE